MAAMVDPKKLSPDEALDLFLDEARAGLADEWLAEQADVSVRQVQLWKKRRGISTDKASTLEAVSALRGLVQDYKPALHVVGPVEGWDAPLFVLRQALDYTQLARACFTLTTVSGFTTEQLGMALGIRPSDVEQALRLWRRHLVLAGRRCLNPGCAIILDPRFDDFCSRSCHDQATKP